MKKLFFSLSFTMLITFSATRLWSQANTELSNLVSPTKVNVNLQPTNDNSKNLGSDSKSWKDIYFDGYLYLDGQRFISNPGIANTFVGNLSGNTSMTGSYNSAFGSDALISNTTGDQNSAFGTHALYSSTTGNFNSAFGDYTLQDNTSGNHNSAFGNAALLSNSGSYNSAYGATSLRYNTTGTENSAFGYTALKDNTTGSYNSAFGTEALSANTIGSQNSVFGNQAGVGNTSGNYGTFVGFDAGGSNSTGSQNTYIGYSTEGSSNSFTNVVGLGYQVTNTASSQARIGNSSTISIGGYASWTNISDGRFKKNIKEEVAGLAFINKLRPVTYNLDVHAADAFVGKEFSGDHETEASAKISEQAKSEKEKIIYSGFIAQEVETAAKEIGYNFSGVDAPKNEKDLYGLRYAEFVVPLVKAVQELDENDDVQTSRLAAVEMENEKLKIENSDLKARIERIESQLEITGQLKEGYGNVNRAVLDQNIPNPAKNSTTIGFYIPAEASNAQLIITDANGKTIQQFSNLMVGQSQVEISIFHLSSGTYQYSLYIDGKKADTKQMIISN